MFAVLQFGLSLFVFTAVGELAFFSCLFGFVSLCVCFLVTKVTFF